MRVGFNHGQTTLLLVLLNTAIISLAIIMRSYPDKIMIPLVLAIAISLAVAINRVLLRKMKRSKKETV
jgi:hypothetical protein